VAASLKAQIQVACAPEAAASWKLLPAVEKVLPFNFGEGSSLADWANLLGNVREPDFQVCLNLASGRQVDLMLSMSHIPTRVATGGFSATERIALDPGTWPQQALAAYLRPLGIGLDANAFRLALPKAALDQAGAALPPGQGPALLLAPASAASLDAADWPASQWQGLQERVRQKLADLRVVPPLVGNHLVERAAQVASCDVVLSSDRPSPPAFYEQARSLGLGVTRSVSFPTMARTRDEEGGQSKLVSFKAVESGYPLRGRLRLSEGPGLPEQVAQGVPGPGEACVFPHRTWPKPPGESSSSTRWLS
jgi:hypothetical protein